MKAVQYTNRTMVLHYLTQLIHDKLSPKERKVIYLHCGFGRDLPMSFRELANRYSFDTLKSTQACYEQAIQKTRDSIAGSELENWIAFYQPLSGS